MIRSKWSLFVAVAGLMVVPAGLGLAQEAEQPPCFSEGDGSALGEPVPCPEEPEIGGPSVEAPDDEQEPTDEQEKVAPAPDQDDDDAVSAQPQAQQAGLADTGADAGVLAFVAVGALGLGALALVVSRWGRGDSKA